MKMKMAEMEAELKKYQATASNQDKDGSTSLPAQSNLSIEGAVEATKADEPPKAVEVSEETPKAENRNEAEEVARLARLAIILEGGVSFVPESAAAMREEEASEDLENHPDNFEPSRKRPGGVFSGEDERVRDDQGPDTFGIIMPSQTNDQGLIASPAPDAEAWNAANTGDQGWGNVTAPPAWNDEDAGDALTTNLTNHDTQAYDNASSFETGGENAANTGDESWAAVNNPGQGAAQPEGVTELGSVDQCADPNTDGQADGNAGATQADAWNAGGDGWCPPGAQAEGASRGDQDSSPPADPFAGDDPETEQEEDDAPIVVISNIAASKAPARNVTSGEPDTTDDLLMKTQNEVRYQYDRTHQNQYEGYYTYDAGEKVLNPPDAIVTSASSASAMCEILMSMFALLADTTHHDYFEDLCQQKNFLEMREFAPHAWKASGIVSAQGRATQLKLHELNTGFSRLFKSACVDFQESCEDAKVVAYLRPLALLMREYFGPSPYDQFCWSEISAGSDDHMDIGSSAMPLFTSRLSCGVMPSTSTFSMFRRLEIQKKKLLSCRQPKHFAFSCVQNPFEIRRCSKRSWRSWMTAIKNRSLTHLLPPLKTSNSARNLRALVICLIVSNHSAKLTFIRTRTKTT
jgi:hypothetical protein